MKKIMFNDYVGLTQAVLEGSKTMTRRIAYISQHGADVLTGKFPNCPQEIVSAYMLKARYRVGEIVAIAECYSDISRDCHRSNKMICYFPSTKAGWKNKMFVRADLMPHHIQITSIKVERLQDISDEDCLKEGVVRIDHEIPNYAKQSITTYYPCLHLMNCDKQVGWGRTYRTPQEAFAVLIDKVSRKGTWESNPYVWAYEFELID